MLLYMNTECVWRARTGLSPQGEYNQSVDAAPKQKKSMIPRYAPQSHVDDLQGTCLSGKNKYLFGNMSCRDLLRTI